MDSVLEGDGFAMNVKLVLNVKKDQKLVDQQYRLPREVEVSPVS